MASVLHLGYDVLNGGAFEPAVAVARVITAPCSIHTQEACESVQSQLALKDSGEQCARIEPTLSRDRGIQISTVNRVL